MRKMKNMHPSTTAALLLALSISLGLSAAQPPKRELYVPMDYSACGYHASEQPLPDVAVSVYVAEAGRLLGVAQLVVEGIALPQSAHVEFHAVGAQLAGQCELAQLLPFQHHPVAHAHLVAVSV